MKRGNSKLIAERGRDLMGLMLATTMMMFLTGVTLKAQVTLTEKQWELPTYPVAEEERNPIFFRNEAYQGASRHYYPLTQNDQYEQERVIRPWHTLVLANEYIELGVMPEIGGKLYYATDKTNGYNFVYKNTVVKPSNIGMTGAWVSGGIEWCVLHHHRASTFRKIDYTTTANEDGSRTIWIGESEPRHGMRWSIGITMYPGRSYFEAEGMIHNASPFTHTFLSWANVAVHANENYQTIFPPSVQVATYHSKTDFTRWPISTEVYRGSDFTEGVDVSWWKNVESSNSFFAHDLKEDFMGGYDHGRNAGTVHVGNHHIVKGAKLWEWGSGPRGQATEARLTDDDGPYVEIMVGAYSDNQPDYSWIRPYETKRWKQYWYPVKGIEGFKNASLNGAVNLEKREKDMVFLGYHTTRKVEQASVRLKHRGELIFEQSLTISPDKPFSRTIKLVGPFAEEDLYTELTDASTGEVLVSYQPVKPDPVEELPETVKGYADPGEIGTVEELYLTGRRVEQFYAPRYDPMDWYREALNRDPGDVRTNTAVGNDYLKNGDYPTARFYLSRAIERLTKDYTRPDDCEALYLQGLTLRAMGLIDEAVDTLYRATWDHAWYAAAYFQLAQISAGRDDFTEALRQVNESLSTNSRNNRAIALKASLQRKTGDAQGALRTVSAVAEGDPLDFRLMNELYLATRDAGEPDRAAGVLATLDRNMRDFNHNYLELAVGYIEDGLREEAKEVLLRFKGDHPVIGYYLGYLHHLEGDRNGAERMFLSASGMPVDYVFPYRLRTLEPLQTALRYNPQDGKASYYMGNILYEKQPGRAIEHWEDAVEKEPGLAIAHRNLGWGYYRHYGDLSKAIHCYEKAIALNGNEPIYYFELDELYEMVNAPVGKRLALFDGKNEVVRKRDDAFVRQLAVLTLAGQPDKAIAYMSGMKFSYREGNSRAREVMIDARLMAGLKHLEEGHYQSALDLFLEAQIPEEEAGSRRMGNRGIQVNYLIGLAYEKLGQRKQAKAYFHRAASQEADFEDVMAYYQGLSLSKTGDADGARKVFEAMIENGKRQIDNPNTQSEFGVIFGARESEDVRKSRAHTLRGLGYKGLGQTDLAKADLSMALELSVSNLWARTESRMQ